MVPLTYVSLGLVALLVGDDHSVFSVVLAILGIGALIFLHELGHFMACRLTGTRVETFAVGMGPRLFGWERPKGGRSVFTRGPRRFDPSTEAMDFRISAIPLGGYVKMAGEIGGDGTATSGVGAAREPKPDEFPGKSIPQRFLIAIAGVVMNALTAIAFFAVAYGIGYLDAPPVLGDVAPGGAAWKAGLRPGDRIVAYDGERIRTFMDLGQEVVLAPLGAEAVVEFERLGADGKRTPMSVRVTPAREAGAEFQSVGAARAASLTIAVDDGRTVRIGPTDVATVDGRRVVGGAHALAILQDALPGGRPVAIEVTGEAPATLTLGRGAKAAAEPASGPWKLGAVPWTPLRVEALRAGGAAATRLRVDDEFVAADGEPLARLADLVSRTRLATLTVRRGGAEQAVAVDAADRAAVVAFLDDVAFPRVHSATDGPTRVDPDGASFPDGVSPLAVAGVRPGDTIVSIAGKPVASWKDVLAAGATLSSTPIVLVVRTGDLAPREVTVTPRRVGASPRMEARYAEEKVPVDGPLDALALGAKRTWSEVRNVFRTIARFFSGDISFSKNVQGPLSIAKFSSGAAGQGTSAFLAFLAFISVNLAVLNVLPIPILDGGTMLLLLVEAVRRKRVPDAMVARLQMVGFALLMLLMVFALKNDVKNLFFGG